MDGAGQCERHTVVKRQGGFVRAFFPLVFALSWMFACASALEHGVYGAHTRTLDEHAPFDPTLLVSPTIAHILMALSLAQTRWARSQHAHIQGQDLPSCERPLLPAILGAFDAVFLAGPTGDESGHAAYIGRTHTLVRRKRRLSERHRPHALALPWNSPSGTRTTCPTTRWN